MNIFLLLSAGCAAAYALSKNRFIEAKPVAFLLVLSFLFTALFWKEPEVIVDASRYFTQAKHLELYGVGYFLSEWGRGIAAWTDMPAMPFFYGLIFRLFGENRLYIQLFTTTLFSMSVVLTYLTGKELWDENIGFYAGMMLLGMPYIFTQTPLMLVDVPSMFFLALAIFSFIKALKCGGAWIALSSLAIFLAFYSKYSTWLMLSILAVIFPVYLRIGSLTSPSANSAANTSILHLEGLTPKKALICRAALIMSIAALLIGMVFMYKFDFFESQIRFLMSYQKPGLKRWGESFVSTFLFQVHPFITAAALYSAYAAFKKKDIKYIIAAWLVFLIVLLQIKRIRYTVMVFPSLALMASYGLCEIKDGRLKRFAALCILMYSLIIANFAYLPFMQKISIVNIKNAGARLDAADIKSVEVFTLPPNDALINPAIYVPILDLFTKKHVHYNYTLDFVPPMEEIKDSSLRFTWEYKNPAYYAPAAGNENHMERDKAVLIISTAPDDKIPDYIMQRIRNYRLLETFKVSDDVFACKSFAALYLPSAAGK